MNCAIISDKFEIANIEETKEKLRKIILDEYNKGSTDFYTNCECGIPLWTAEIICGLKKQYEIRLHIVVPYEEQAADWTEEQRDIYYYVHEHSDSVIFSRIHFQSDCYEIAEKAITEKCEKNIDFPKFL